MTFTPRVGMICVTRDGRKVGPMSRGIIGEWHWECDASPRLDPNTRNAWRADGSFRPLSHQSHPLDLVAEWTDEPALPVRTRTVTEIIPGEYNGIMISEPGDYAVFIRMHIEDHGKFMDAPSLRAAARVFQAVAEALETTS